MAITCLRSISHPAEGICVWTVAVCSENLRCFGPWLLSSGRMVAVETGSTANDELPPVGRWQKMLMPVVAVSAERPAIPGHWPRGSVSETLRCWTSATFSAVLRPNRESQFFAAH